MGILLIVLLVLPLLLMLLLKFSSREKINGNQKAKLVECNEWNNIPKISMIAFILTARDLSKTIFRLSNLFKQVGKVFRVKVFTEECFFLNDPVLAQKILTSKMHGHYPKPQVFYQPLRDIFGNGVLTSQGEYWQTQRKILSKGFTYSALRRYCKTYNSCAKQLVVDLEKKYDPKDGIQYYQIGSMIHLCSITIITKTVMGLDITDHEGHADLVLDSFNNLKDIAMQRLRKGFFLFWNPIWKLHPLSRENTRNINNVDNAIKRMILKYRNGEDKNREDFKHENATLSKDNDEDVKFECMLELMYKSGLNEKQILDEVKTLIWAGYETTSAAIHYLLFLLALNQTHQEACRNEVAKIFADPKHCQNGELSMEGLLDMKCLERCILETLRIFPIVLCIMRQLECPLQIDETLEIPDGGVGIPIAFYHKMEEYFPNPEMFVPDRFLTGNSLKPQSSTFMPFSAGPRICIGLKFAMLEAKTIVAHILRDFEVPTNDKFEDVPIIPALVSYPERDYYFYLKKRNNANTLQSPTY